MRSIKTLLFWLSWWLISRWISFAQSSEEHFFYGDQYTQDPSTDIGDMIKHDFVDNQEGVVMRLLRSFGLEQFTLESNASALEYAKYIINVALALVWFIALGVVLYGFVQIIFAKDDEGISKAKKIVSGAALAIAIIALSRFLVSFLFNLYEQFIS